MTGNSSKGTLCSFTGNKQTKLFTGCSCMTPTWGRVQWSPTCYTGIISSSIGFVLCEGASFSLLSACKQQKRVLKLLINHKTEALRPKWKQAEGFCNSVCVQQTFWICVITQTWGHLLLHQQVSHRMSWWWHEVKSYLSTKCVQQI